ncbi:alpha/beta hydrolase [Phytohabitans sp. ZYX-F-186]|uniref:Alpha/beta hydrolase n=1 Tax=Phytohabitans maris TaxID=3071409 RepID=A0ABU0ZDS4_9ACTN|nr:alpha/beta hydrolase [Phytohabitans sp. ZYX-F-186]MDQ7904475.1 alpha/beta hydrolase [Phytohabitans sp. ZYX-F-186]
MATVRLHYRSWGSAENAPVILLHGGGTDSATWADVVAPALSEQWRVYAPDLRGHGKSEWPGEYSLELMRDDVLELMDEIGTAPVSLVGHSMGGAVAYLVTLDSPERVRRLVLEEAPPPVPLALPMPARPAEPVPYDFDVRPAIVAQLNTPDPAWWTRADEVAVPTLVISGGPASHLPQRTLYEFAARLPGGRLVTVPAGHRVHTTAPEPFLEAVLAFLE